MTDTRSPEAPNHVDPQQHQNGGPSGSNVCWCGESHSIVTDPDVQLVWGTLIEAAGQLHVNDASFKDASANDVSFEHAFLALERLHTKAAGLVAARA